MNQRSPHPSVAGSRPGNILLLVVFILFGLATASAVFYAFQAMGLRQVHARDWTEEARTAAEGAARVMGERLMAVTELNLGVLTQEDVDSLNAGLASLTLPDGTTLDEDVSGYFVTHVGVDEWVPFDNDVLRFTSDQPRFSFTAQPRPDGARASSTLEVTIVARAHARAARATAMARYGIAKVLPHGHVLYTAGDMEICVTPPSTLIIDGSLLADGDLVSRCDGDRTYYADLMASEDLVVEGSGAQDVMVNGAGPVALASRSREDFEGDAQTELAQWGGQVRSGAGMGGQLITTRLQDSVHAGTGECEDATGACAGEGSFFPSIQLQRVTTGSGGEFDVRCGWSYDGEDCDEVAGALRYWPYPWTSAPNPAVAGTDPVLQSNVWRGLYPDYRRESRCTASMGAVDVRTFRCSSNAFGYVLDVSLLPPIPGGMLHVQSWTGRPAGMSPFQEVLLVKNAERFAGPLTVISEIPVVLEGSVNTVNPKPVLIDAPLITVLPNEAEEQLNSSVVWDSVSPGPVVLNAQSPVSIRAVLRSNYHRTGAGYYGGTVEQIPAVLGDFSATTLTVLGAIEGREQATDATGAYALWHAPRGAEPSDLSSAEPSSRRIQFDDRLATQEGVAKGSWFWPNIPSAGGAGGTRTRARQERASGGYTVIRRLEETSIVSTVDTATVAVPVTSMGSPQSPVALFTAEEDTLAQVVNFDATSSSDPDGTVSEYHWRFGDGTAGFGDMQSHAYAGAGPYMVRLTVTDSIGLVATDSLSVLVEKPGAVFRVSGLGPSGPAVTRPPTATLSVPSVFLQHVESYADASASSDPDGMVIGHYWTFGDSTDAWGAMPRKAYADTGSYSVALTVWDEDLAWDGASDMVTVKEQAVTCPHDMTCVLWDYSLASAVNDSTVSFASSSGSVGAEVTVTTPTAVHRDGSAEYSLTSSMQTYQVDVYNPGTGWTLRGEVRAKGTDGDTFTITLDWASAGNKNVGLVITPGPSVPASSITFEYIAVYPFI